MPRGPEGNVDLRGSLNTVSFDPDAFDVALRSQGVKLVHWRAMPCPVGKTDRYDARRGDHDHSGCSNGNIYTLAGEMTCIFTANGNKLDQMDMGLLDGSTAQVTAPANYDTCEKRIDVMPFDRFYLKEEAIMVPHAQLVEAHATGHDRLDYPAVEIIDIIDANNVRHGPGEYSIQEGQLVWEKPLDFRIELNRGMIYAVRFYYRPYWYVKTLMHQVRVAQVETQLSREVMRFPQQWLMQREYIFEKEEKDALAPDPNSPRQVKGPRNSILGPR